MHGFKTTPILTPTHVRRLGAEFEGRKKIRGSTLRMTFLSKKIPF